MTYVSPFATVPGSQLALVDRLRRLPFARRRALYQRLDALGPEAIASLGDAWEGFWGRPDQVVPRDHPWTLIVFAGPRGDGKTEAGIRLWAREIEEGRFRLPRFFGHRQEDLEKFVAKRILPALPPHRRPVEEQKGRVLRFPCGTVAYGLAAAGGAQQAGDEGDGDLYDDVAAWEEHRAAAWSQARVSCRKHPGRGIVTTTPRSDAEIRQLLNGSIAEVRRAPYPRPSRYNLAADYYERLERELGGTEFYAREILGLDVGSSPFAGIEWADHRVDFAPALDVVAVWIDPATSDNIRSCEVGIVAVGIDAEGELYGLADRSAVLNAEHWPEVALRLRDDMARRYPEATLRIGIETNRGGNMGPALLHQAERIRRKIAGAPPASGLDVREVHADKSKAKRAGPVAAHAKRGHVHTLRGLQVVEGQLLALDEMVETAKLDRADAFIWAALDVAGWGEAQPWSAGDISPASPDAAPVEPYFYGPPVGEIDPYDYSPRSAPA